MVDGKRNIWVARLLFAAILFFYPFSVHCQAAILQSIYVISSDEVSDVVLRFDEKIRYKYSSLSSSDNHPERCYIDLYNTSSNQNLPAMLPVDDQHILKVRTGVYAEKIRVVVDLKNKLACTVTASVIEPFQIQISLAQKDPLRVEQITFPKSEMAKEDHLSDHNQNTLPSLTAISEKEPQLGESSPVDTSNDTAETETSSFTSGTPEIGKIYTWGWFKAFSAYDTNKDQAEDQHLSRLQGRIGGQWEKEISFDSSLKFHAAIHLNQLFYDSEFADKEADLDFHETYLQFNKPDWDVTIGKQRVRWGKSDQFSPIDNINPQDYRQFVTVDLEERALPSWLLRGRWYGESIGLEMIFQPWFQESTIEYFDSDWALYRNLRQTIIYDPLTPGWLKDYSRNISVKESRPSNTLKNVSAAARITWQSDQADFALSYHYGWETLPTITSFPVKNIQYTGDPNTDPNQFLSSAVFTDEQVQAVYKRQQGVGFEWETVIDPIGFRGEIAHIDNVSFLSSNFTSERKPTTHLVSGIDYTSEKEWYFNLQGSWQYINDYAKEILYFERNVVSIYGEISKPIWRGNLELSAIYNYTITDQSSYLQPSVTLNYFRNFNLEIGAMFFFGEGRSLLGSYDDADQIYGDIKFSF